MCVLDSSSWIFLPHESYFGTGTIIVGWCEWLRSTLRKFSNVAISPNCYRLVHRSKILTTLTGTTAWFPSSATKLFPLIPPSNSSTFTSCCRGLDWCRTADSPELCSSCLPLRTAAFFAFDCAQTPTNSSSFARFRGEILEDALRVTACCIALGSEQLLSMIICSHSRLAGTITKQMSCSI